VVARVIFPLLLIIGAVVGIGIVYPTLNGPFRVDCGLVDETTCEQAWREFALHEEGLDAYLPITRVRVTADHTDEPVDCLDIYVERWIFATSVINDCL
jgi:hypothetical protein